MVAGGAMGGAAGDPDGRCALVLGITGPEPDLGETQLDTPAPLAYASGRAEELAGSLAAYGYRDLLETLGGAMAAADDVQRSLDAALTKPGLVVVHLLTHGEQGQMPNVLHVLGP